MPGVDLTVTAMPVNTHAHEHTHTNLLCVPSDNSLKSKPVLEGTGASLGDLVQYFVLLMEVCAVCSL